MPSDKEYFEIKERAAKRFLQIPGVTAVGIGGKEKDGIPTGEICIKVFVAEKKAPKDIPLEQLIPPMFEGVPTDVSVLHSPRPINGPPGKPRMTDEQLDEGCDHERHRPLVGGSQIQVDLPGAGVGTLGCFMQDEALPDKIYALTCHHVLENTAPLVAGQTKVGQPTHKDSITKCCSAIFGMFAAGSETGLRDAALVKVDSDMQWLAEILDIGIVKGSHPLSIAEVAPLNYQVRKRGRTSCLTGGKIQAINASLPSPGRSNDIIIRPNPDPSNPGTLVYFAQEGDSGSALVNKDNEVVGLVYLMVTGSNPAFNVQTGDALATPLESYVGSPGTGLIDQFFSINNLQVRVTTANISGVIHTVPGAAMTALAPEAVLVLTAERPPDSLTEPVGAPDHLLGDEGGLRREPIPSMARVQSDLDRSLAGRSLITLWLDNQEELTQLINTNRKVATVWHRSGAAGLFQILMRMVSSPSTEVPQTLNGQPVSHCIDRVHEILRRFASPPLSSDLARARSMLPDLAGRTYPQILVALDTT